MCALLLRFGDREACVLQIDTILSNSLQQRHIFNRHNRDERLAPASKNDALFAIAARLMTSEN